MADDKKKWIQGAIKHPGALTAQAEKAGAINEEGDIKAKWLAAKARSKNLTIARRARLAQLLKRFNKKK